MNGVDTNVLIYSLDRNEPVKQSKAQQLLQSLHLAAEPTWLPWQVLGELTQQLRRWRDQGKISEPDFVQHVHAYRYLFPIALPREAVLDHALDLSQRFSLSHWDSMLLGACQDAGIHKLYTEDMGSPRTMDQIQLINPFS